MKSSVAILVATTVAVAGCSVFKRQDADYQASSDRAPLAVPPGLDQPVTTAPETLDPVSLACGAGWLNPVANPATS